jgi:hypothetical protein
MLRRKLVTLLILLACGLSLVGGALAANGMAIERSVIAGGGEPVTDGSLYVLNGTIGEPVAGAIALQAGYGLGSGFWWPPGFKIYLPLVLRNHS